jgi:glyoxylase-like metal-dependent hydrolase (beta-lactamase superfamily II)
LAERQNQDPRFSNVRLIPPTIELEAGGSIDGGDFTLELKVTPGHTIDHLSVWLPVQRLLLAGDAAEYPIPYCDQRSDIATFVTTLRQLKGLNPTVVIPCHGGPTDSGLLDRNIAYFVRLDAITREAIVAGVIPGDWKQRVNVADNIGYSFEQAMLDLGIDPSTISEFYRNSHQLAIRSTIARVMTGSPAL